MKVDLKEMLPADFDDNSRVWVYQSSRLFSLGEAFEIEKMLEEFVASWQSHGTPVKGYANLFYGHFVLTLSALWEIHAPFLHSNFPFALVDHQFKSD